MRVAAGFDGREGGRDAIALARLLLGDAPGGMTVVAVVPFTPSREEADSSRERAPSFEEHCRERRAVGERLIGERAADLLEGVDAERTVLLDDSPARALTMFAESECPDALTLGSTHRGRLGRVMAGGIPHKLLSGAPCAIAVSPRGYADAERRATATIKVGFNGGEESLAALDTALALARRHAARLEVVCVVEPARSLELEMIATAGRVLAGEGLDDHREDRLRSAAEERLAERGEGVEWSVETAHGEAAELLATAAESDADLLVLGSRGYGPLRRVLLGSTSAGLLESAPCPVLVVPRP